MESLYHSQSDSFSRRPAGFCRLSLFCSILLPYLPPPIRQPILLFSKIYECLECFHHGKRFCSSCPDYSRASSQEQLSDIFSKLSPFLDEQERSRFSQMQNMMQMMSLYQAFQDIAPFMAQASGSENPFGSFSDAEANPGFGNSNTRHDSANNGGNHYDSADNDGIGHASAGNDGFQHSDSASGFSPNTDMLYSMLSPEQQEMFQNIKAVMGSAASMPDSTGMMDDTGMPNTGMPNTSIPNTGTPSSTGMADEAF